MNYFKKLLSTILMTTFSVSILLGSVSASASSKSNPNNSIKDVNSYSTKTQVENMASKKVAAVERVQALVINTDQDAANVVNDAIAALPDVENVVIGDETAINDTNNKYNSLTDDQKLLVSADNKTKLSAVLAKLTELKLWTLKWSDEFNGPNGTSIDKSKWVFDIGRGANGDGWGNQEQETYTDSTNNVYQQDGNLVIAAQKNNSGVITSGRVKTLGSLDMKYGRIDVRAKLPSGTGYWPAIWMLPSDNVYGTWAASGEIDIMENKGRLPNEEYGTIHYGAAWPNNKYTGNTYKFPSGTDVTSYHVYSLEWEPGEIRWYVDGQLYQTQNNWSTKDNNGEKVAFPAPFDQKFHLLLNLAYGGTFDGMNGDGTNIPGKMEVDYVRAYDLTGRAYKTPVEPSVSAEALPDGAKQADSNGNLLSNGDFSQAIKDNPAATDAFAYDWNFVHSTDTGTGTQTIDQINGIKYGKFNVTNGGSNNYSVQLIQETTIGKGRWYKLSFDAKSNTSRTLGVKVGGGPSRGYASYADPLTCNLTDQFKPFETTFQMTAASDLIARIEFELGLNTNPVWIGNVKLVEIPAPTEDYNASKNPLPDGNLIYNGAFDKGNIDRMTYWNFTTSGANAIANVPEATREFSSDITSGGNTPEAILLSQKGIQLKANGAYTLTFKARSSSDRTIKVGLYSKDGITNYSGDNTINITKDMKQYNYSFTMNNTNDLESQLIFKLGGDNNNVYLDDVSLKKGIDYSNIDVYPLKNGNFTEGTDGLANWTAFPNTIGDAASTISTVNSEAKISITNPGNTAYSIMLMQDKLSVASNVEYKVAFDARSTADRSILVTAENAAYKQYFSQTMSLSSTLTHYEYTFVMPVDEVLALKFQLGNVGTMPTSPHDIFISNVQFEVNNAPFKKAPTLVSSTTNNKLTQPIDITFADDANWRTAITAIKINNTAISSSDYTVSSGKITLAASNFPTTGDYNIAVIASGYANANTVQTITANDNLIINNGTFNSNVTGWQTYSGDGSDAAVSSVNGEMKVAFTNYAGWFKWSTQVYQDTIKLEAGKTYVLKFDARSTVARDAWMEMTNLDQKTLALTNTNQTFTYEFTAAATINNAKLNFLLGTNNVDGSLFVRNQSVYLDNISITEKPPTPVITAEKITNGTFDTDVTGWQNYLADGSDAAVSSVNGEMKVAFTNYAGWFKWSTQVYQDTIKLEAGKTYVLKFDARSTVARDAWMEMTNLDQKTLALTNTNQTFTYEFTAAATINNAKLNFLLGTNNVDGSLFVRNQSVYLDNISIVEGKLFSVVFKDKTGNNLKSEMVVNNEAAIPPSSPALNGYIFKGWDKQFNKVTSDMVINAIYERSAKTYNVAVVHGKLSTGGVTGNYQFDMPVTVVADTVPSKKFSYWELDGKKVSIDSSYTFFVPMNTTLLTAIYVDEAAVVENKPFITLLDNVMIDTTNKTMVFTAARTVPTGYTLVESGVLLTSNAPLNGDLTVDTTNAIHGKIGNDSTSQFYIRKLNITSGDTWYARAYLIYNVTGSSNNIIVYSDNIAHGDMNGGE